MKLFSFGEILIDFLAKGGSTDGRTSGESFEKYAGGAPANLAVAASRLGVDSHFIGRVGDDLFGHFLLEELAFYGVSTAYVGISSTAKTALAFVSLDQHGERSFQFYADNAAHNECSSADFAAVTLTEPALFSFCSSMLATDTVFSATRAGIGLFRAHHSIICFDINYRPAFWDCQERARRTILEIVEQTDLVKVSREELAALYGVERVEEMVDLFLDKGVSLVQVTDGANAIKFYSHEFSGTLPVPPAEVVDTTAAGDAFFGALLTRIANENRSRDTFKEWAANFESVIKAVGFSARCGTFAVSGYGAFASLPSMEDV